jgi:hypothetical protein
VHTKYTPKPGTARCPHCRAQTTAPLVGAGGLSAVYLMYYCPACGQKWNEVREVGQRAERFWTSVPAATRRPA